MTVLHFCLLEEPLNLTQEIIAVRRHDNTLAVARFLDNLSVRGRLRQSQVREG